MNHVAIGLINDKEEIVICPKCASEDTFRTKDGFRVCRDCWMSAPEEDFTALKEDYYGDAEAKNY